MADTATVTGPPLFAEMVGTGEVGDTTLAFVIGALVMIVAGLVEAVLGVKANARAWRNSPRR